MLQSASLVRLHLHESVTSLKTACGGGGGGDPCVDVGDGAMDHSGVGEKG